MISSKIEIIAKSHSEMQRWVKKVKTAPGNTADKGSYEHFGVEQSHIAFINLFIYFEWPSRQFGLLNIK